MHHGIMSIYLVAGLGNPGPEYTWTRHNLGFLVVEYLVQRFPVEKSEEIPGKYRADLLTLRTREGIQSVWLVRPLAYMNRSGGPVRECLQRWKVSLDHFLVVLDDFMLPWKTFRLRPSGSHGGHNGLRSIIEALGTQYFARLRIGCGPIPEGMDPAHFVLQPMESELLQTLPRVQQYASVMILLWVERGPEVAGSWMNGSLRPLTDNSLLKRYRWFSRVVSE